MKRRHFFAAICIMLAVMFTLASCAGGGKDKEYSLDREEGYRQLTIYYNREAGYDGCDIWLWYGSVAGRGYDFHTCGYGAKVVVNVPEEIDEVGFIIRTGCSNPGGTEWGNAVKDGTDSNRAVKLTGDYTVIYTKSGDANSYTSNDGGKTLEIIKFVSIADMQDLTHVKVTMSDGSSVKKEEVKIKDGSGAEVSVASVSNNVISLAAPLDLAKAYTLEVTGVDPVGIVPMTYFSSDAFATAYTYDGELGVELKESSTVFRLWAPTASAVKLNLFDNGTDGGAEESVDMVRGEKGVWSYTHAKNLAGKYYTYTVTTSLGTQEAVDPYARSAGTNGKRGMILDLSTTDPDGWVGTPFDNPAVENYTDAQIWEVHIRDFSNKIEGSKYKGKYLAFTETGLKNKNGMPVGVDYLKQLGITHVHLLPSFDYASVDESKSEGFNWGYDPDNYNVPEGSYSTDPSDGAKRVTEYKQMVQALHNQGISVVMDVVYNHTFSTDSNFNKIVPYYYYRYGADGKNSNGSGCGNETASERSMVRKFMIDSVTYWQEEYNLDGFRFDLMGVHDIETMQLIEKAVHERNPEALIYGEGWTGGTVAIPESEQAVLKNLRKLNENTSNSGVNGIAMFNDVIRDGIKGSVFEIDDKGFATGATKGKVESILFGVAGATGGRITEYQSSWYAQNPTQVINYASAHDNNTLWDRICHVYGEEGSTLAKRTAMNRLSAAIVQTSLGVPFMQAGEEMLRAKKNADGTYNENSYNASDAVNNIDWDLLSASSEQYQTMQYYKGLIEFRKSCETLRLTSSTGKNPLNYVCRLAQKSDTFVAFTATHPETGEKLLIIYNAAETAVDYTLPAGNWDLYIDGTRAGATVLQDDVSGAQKIAGISCYVYKLDVKA